MTPPRYLELVWDLDLVVLSSPTLQNVIVSDFYDVDI